MFAGPGAGPLLAAAAAWDGLAEELASAATAFGSVTSDLAGNAWLGPSSAAMMAVATQYVGLLSAAAAQAEQASAQAAATASAFEAALAATVQPAVVAANRGLLQVLAATNWLGQNSPAIMDIESAYEQMWALDVSAMSGYHVDASAAAGALAPWQQVLSNLGINISNNGQISLGFGNTGSGNMGSGNSGSSNMGSGNTGNSNAGSGNYGNSNVGSGNTGSGNVGFGNNGNNNFGFANTGNGDIGFGLTGDHQIGFGGFNSGSGNIGIGNSGTGNIGFFNSGSGNVGIGNTGSLNSGLFNSGSANMGMANTGSMNSGLYNSGFEQTGFAGQGAEASLLTSSTAATGGISAANASSSLLSSAAETGGFNTALRHPGIFAPDMPAQNVGNSSNVATALTGTSSTPTAGLSGTAAVVGSNAGPAMRGAYPGLINARSADGEPRNSNTRESDNLGAGIPRSGFYPNRQSDETSEVLRLPVRSD